MEGTPDDKVFACSLDAEQFRTRRQEWRALGAVLLASHDRPGGMTAIYRGDERTLEVLRGLVEAERSCCPDFEWRLEREGDAVRLDVDFR